MKSTQALLLALFGFLVVAEATITGCPSGQAAIASSSIPSGGSLQDGGFRVRAGRTSVPNGADFVIAGPSFDIFVDLGPNGFQEILIRVEGTVADQIEPVDPATLQVATDCGTTGAVIDADATVQKKKAVLNLYGMKPGQYPVDITLIANDADGILTSYYSNMRLEVPTTIFDVVAENKNLTILHQALLTTGQDAELSTPYRDYTLFAPTNAALLGLSPKFLTEAWQIHLEHILYYHVALGTYMAETLTDGQSILTMETDEEPITVSTLSEGGVSLSGPSFSNSQIVASETMAENGVVHFIDTMFLPEALTVNMFEYMMRIPANMVRTAQMVVTSGLETRVGRPGRTFFVPSDKAMNTTFPDEGSWSSFLGNTALVEETIKRHLVVGVFPELVWFGGLALPTTDGREIVIRNEGTDSTGMFDRWSAGGAAVLQTDIVASNGLLVLIDGLVEATDIPTEAPEFAPEELENDLEGGSDLEGEADLEGDEGSYAGNTGLFNNGILPAMK